MGPPECSSLPDIPLVPWHSLGSVRNTCDLIVLDELLARLPLARTESWHVIVRADAVPNGSR